MHHFLLKVHRHHMVPNCQRWTASEVLAPTSYLCKCPDGCHRNTGVRSPTFAELVVFSDWTWWIRMNILIGIDLWIQTQGNVHSFYLWFEGFLPFWELWHADKSSCQIEIPSTGSCLIWIKSMILKIAQKKRSKVNIRQSNGDFEL